MKMKPKKRSTKHAVKKTADHKKNYTVHPAVEPPTGKFRHAGQPDIFYASMRTTKK